MKITSANPKARGKTNRKTAASCAVAILIIFHGILPLHAASLVENKVNLFYFDLSVLFLQTRVQVMKKGMDNPMSEEELAETLQGLQSIAAGAMDISQQLQRLPAGSIPGFQKTDYQSRMNAIIVSVFSAHRQALDDSSAPSVRVQAVESLASLSDQLSPRVASYAQALKSRDLAVRVQALRHLGEISSIFIVLDPLTKVLSGKDEKDAPLRVKTLEAFTNIGEILSLIHSAYSLSLQDPEVIPRIMAQWGVKKMDPFLTASLPALNLASKSKNAAIQGEAAVILNTIREF